MSKQSRRSVPRNAPPPAGYMHALHAHLHKGQGRHRRARADPAAQGQAALRRVDAAEAAPLLDVFAAGAHERALDCTLLQPCSAPNSGQGRSTAVAKRVRLLLIFWLAGKWATGQGLPIFQSCVLQKRRRVSIMQRVSKLRFAFHLVAKHCSVAHPLPTLLPTHLPASYSFGREREALLGQHYVHKICSLKYRHLWLDAFPIL